MSSTQDGWNLNINIDPTESYNTYGSFDPSELNINLDIDTILDRNKQLNLGNSDKIQQYEKTFYHNQNSNFYSPGYNDIDIFLSQDLKELDSPQMPRSHDEHISNSDLGVLNNGLDWGVLENLASITSVNGEDSSSHFNPQYEHKKGPSGTAIFGFSSHNKTLNISKMSKNNDLGSRNNKENIFQMNIDSVNKYPSPIENGIVLNHQNELMLALEKQKEMNRRLEEQLRINQIQQEKLQKALHDQEASIGSLNFSPINNKIGNKSMDSTPQLRVGKLNDDIIITSNVKGGNYQFPPPKSHHSQNSFDLSSPRSGASINGSPKRRHPQNKCKLDFLNNNEASLGSFNNQSYILQSYEPLTDSINVNTNNYTNQSVKSLPDDNNQINLLKSQSMDKLNILDKDNVFTPKSSVLVITSPDLSIASKQHKNKESIASSVSTILMSHDSDDHVTDSDDETRIGLGIQYKKPSKYILNKPPPLTLLPTVFGSKINTPAKSKSELGVDMTKYLNPNSLQYTPNKSPSKGNSTNINNKNPYSYSLLQSRQTNLKSLSDDTVNDLESQFIKAKTTSPILKSQEEFKKYFSNLLLSPNKITKKPTTLPPGEIDKYVKELLDKTFECLFPNCGKKFNRRYNIRSHIQTHLEDRPYMCEFDGCNKAFVRNHDLIRHKKTHAEKSYVCPCGKKFSREDALLTHRTRMICIGGKNFENIVIKKSPRKRGRPRKDSKGNNNIGISPVKETIARDRTGSVTLKMEQQLTYRI